MANDLVVQLGAKLDQFQSDMNAAGDVADSTVSRIEQSFANLNPGINFSSFSAAIVAGAVGVTGLVALVATLNESLAEMAKTAERVGLSFSRFQELKFGANSIGISDSDFSSSLDTFASKLQDAKSKANDLTRVFQAQPIPIAIKDANGNLKDTNDLLTKAFDLIKRAPSIQDALQIGGFLGFSKQFSQSIFDAGDNFLRLAAQANAAGAVIDDATINKAKVFSDEWTKASALWGASLRAALGEILPLLNQAVNGATTLIQSVSSVFGALSAIKDFAFAPDIDTASLNKLTSLLKQYEDIKSTLQSGTPLNPIQLFEASNIPQIDGKVSLEALDKVISQIQARIRQVNASPDTRIVVTPSNPSVNPGLKPAAESRDQFEIAVDSVTKHTATLKADTAAVFQNNAAQAQFRAEFTELTAIMRDHGEVTQAQIDTYEKLRQSMSATQALEAAGITLTKEHRDAFLSSSQAIGTATTAYDKAKDSLSKINSASAQVGAALSSAFADAVVEGKSLNDVMSNLLKTLEKAAINSLFASFFNAGASGGLSPFASALGLGSIGKNAQGTDNWRGGPTWVGENGPEILNLPKGAQVIPNAVARQATSGAQIYNSFMVAGEVSQGTVDRLQAAVVTAHRKVDRLSNVFTSTQRQQATGVA